MGVHAEHRRRRARGEGWSAALHRPGRPLDPALRAVMERRFGHDFSTVRVHDDAAARQTATDADAAALTVGEHVVLGEHADGGERLMAHELAHVVQHRMRSAGSVGDLHPSRPGDPSERQADQAADAVVGGRDPPTLTAAPVGVYHRQALPTAPTELAPPRMLALGGATATLDHFALGSDALPPGADARLDALAAGIQRLLRHYPGHVIEVTGHTDASGSEALNERLGQRRADAVRDALVARGVPAGPLFTSSAGERRPASGVTDQDPADRRVVVAPRAMPRLGPRPISILPPLPAPQGFRSTSSDPDGDPAFVPDTTSPLPPNLRPTDQMLRDIIDPPGPRVRQPDLHLNDPNWPPRTPTQRRSIVGAFGDWAARFADRAAREMGAPPWLRDLARDAARSGSTKLLEKLCEAGIDQAGLTGQGREAALQTCRAVIRQEVIP